MDPLADPEVGFVTLTQRGALVTPPQTQQHTEHQGAAHQVPFNLDDAPTDIGPVHVYLNDFSFRKSASFNSLDYTDVYLTLFIMPVVLVRLEYIGGPSSKSQLMLPPSMIVTLMWRTHPHSN